jgi:putative SOS response-associated peptidase YedK
MCGRFSATFSFRDIVARWNLSAHFELAPRYNIAPSQSVPVIVRGEKGNEARVMKWGLVPSWAGDASIGNRIINARAETLLEKPSFKKLVSQRRCLIPADGFYEWRRDGNRKIPVWIHLKKNEPFAFAGLWDCWRDFDAGSELYSFTIITTEANAFVRPIHSRMPVIYDAALGKQWLEHPGDSAMFLSTVLAPSPAGRMEAWDVSPLVNAPEYDMPECIRPVSAPRTQNRQIPLL